MWPKFIKIMMLVLLGGTLVSCASTSARNNDDQKIPREYVVLMEPYTPTEELQNQEKTGENSSDAEKQTVQEIILFDEYILGEPFEMNSLCEVPVRFVQKKGFVDVVLYFFKNPNENWKINQLQILKMQKKFKNDVR